MQELDFKKGGENIERFRKLFNLPQVVMMATTLDKTPFSICPITILEIDDKGSLWFISSKESGHYKDIERDNRVQLIYSDVVNLKFISVFGNATQIVDDQKVDELWTQSLTEWLEGKNDDRLILYNINIENAHYWDHRTRKLKSFFGYGNKDQTTGTAENFQKGYINFQNH